MRSETEKIEDTAIGSEPDADAFGEIFLNLSQHRTKEDCEERRGQDTALFNAVFDREGFRELTKVLQLTTLTITVVEGSLGTSVGTQASSEPSSVHLG